MMSRWKAQRRRPGQKGGQSPKAGLGLQRAQGLRSLGLQVSTWESWNLKHHPPSRTPLHRVVSSWEGMSACSLPGGSGPM